MTECARIRDMSNVSIDTHIHTHTHTLNMYKHTQAQNMYIVHAVCYLFLSETAGDVVLRCS